MEMSCDSEIITEVLKVALFPHKLGNALHFIPICSNSGK